MKMLAFVVVVLALIAGLVWWRVTPPAKVDAQVAVLAQHDVAIAAVKADLIDSTLARVAQRSRDDSVALLRVKRQLVDVLRSKDSLQRELTYTQTGDSMRIVLSDSIRATVPLAIGAALQARDSVHGAVEAQQARVLAQSDSALVSERARTALLEQRVSAEQDRSLALARQRDVMERLLRPPSRWQRARAAVPVAGSAAVGAGLGSLGGPTGAVVGGAVGAVIGLFARD